MYQWNKPEPRCRRAPDRESAAGFLDAPGMTQDTREPRKVWRVRAESVSSVGKLVRPLMGFAEPTKNRSRMRRYDV